MREAHTEEWRRLLMGDQPALRQFRRLFRRMPHDPRCALCYRPFGGIGGALMRLSGCVPWPRNPRYCTGCMASIAKHPGGAEVECSFMFADVRGSTPLAERLGLSAFAALMNRFVVAASHVVVLTDGLVEKVIGDQVAALYVPGYAGPEHARVAVDAARRVLADTGHGAAGGPWIPVGVGVHTGVAFVGNVGEEAGTVEFAALGDAVNVAARIAGEARPGEVLVSEAACVAAGLECDVLESRELVLKGKSEPIRVRALGANTV